MSWLSKNPPEPKPEPCGLKNPHQFGAPLYKAADGAEVLECDRCQQQFTFRPVIEKLEEWLRKQP